jgi:Eco57I restriction-modification methylase
VFFGRNGQALGDRAGFDTVVGNPPYVRQEQLGPLKPYFAANYPEVFHGIADLFVYFIAQGLRQSREGGLLGYISSNSWLRANYATPLRSYLRTQATVDKIVDLGDNRVFVDAPDVYPAVLLLRRDVPSDGHEAQVATFNRGEGLAHFESRVQGKLGVVSIHDQYDSGWQLGDDLERRVFQKLMAGGRPLGEVVDGKMYRGVLTGLNEAFIVDQATRDRLVQADSACSEFIKPICQGEDLRPWYQENEGRWIIVLPWGWTNSTFGNGLNEQEAWERFSACHPALAGHLYPFAEAARKRQDKGQYWWELRACAYYDAFDKPKIMWPDITKFPRFSWNDNAAFVNDKGFIAVPHESSILGTFKTPFRQSKR